jgi:tricorn protease
VLHGRAIAAFFAQGTISIALSARCGVFMRRLFLSLAALFLATAAGRAEPDIQDTRLLSQPAVSARHIAFVYADDLWVADLDGKNVRRLTSDIGVEMLPVFSPDGKTITFTAEYDGNLDVYTIPVEGGSPTWLTWHPGADMVRGFTPDGKAVLFTSPRHVFTSRFTQLFTVPLTGGMPTQLPIPHADDACFSPDETFIIYTPLPDRSQQWKHYRGGTTSRLWIYNRTNHAIVQVPQPGGRCNDLRPCWLGDTIYFLSDRAGEYNLFAYSVPSKKVRQPTHHNDLPVVSLAAGGGRLIYDEHGVVPP